MIALFRRFVPFALVALAACDSSPTTGPAPNSGGPAPVSGGRAEILFHRKVGSFSQIFAMPADGSAVVQLTAGNANSECARWAPDDRQIAFVRDTSTSAPGRVVTYGVYLMGVDGAHPRRITPDTLVTGCPDWSRDGKRLVFHASTTYGGFRSLYAVNADGSGLVRLTNNRWNDVSPRWSPDGHSLLYQDNKDYFYRMRIASADGSGVRSVPSTCPFDDIAATWSPDGSRIAFECNETSGFAVHTIGADGKDERNLSTLSAPGTPRFDGRPIWSPDGARLLIRRYSLNDTDLFIVFTDGASDVQLTNDPEIEWPTDWRGRRRSVGPE